MSRKVNSYYGRDGGRDWERNDYRYDKRQSSRKRSRSPPSRDMQKRRSRSPRKSEKDLLDENILSEISKLPEPSELWDNQMHEGGFAGPPPSFNQDGGNYGGNYQQSYSGIYDDFPPVASMPASHPPDMASWNQMSLPPAPAPPAYNLEEQIKKEAAIESEMRHQKAALSKQREDYMKKAGILKKELDTLRDQRSELRGDGKRSPSPDTKRFLRENTKLQLEIQNKLKTIDNVVDMLNGIIGEEAHEVPDSDDSAERTSKRKSRSPSSSKKFNYVYYDPEMHWCRVCNEFPPTAKEYLNHLHSPSHHKMAAAHLEAPWHALGGAHEGFPSLPAAPAKRTPIRGLQFFVPSTAWYCKLCDQFIGDLHCASAHLKSIIHSKNYTNFVEQNPHWETDWMSDRQKAFEKARGKAKAEDAPQYAATTITFSKDGFTTRKVSPRRAKKKRKRRSSSSGSSSSSGDSEPQKKKKKSKKSKSKYGSDDKLSEWMSSIKVDRLNENDRKLLDNIKTRITLDKLQDVHRSDQREQRRDREKERRKSRSREKHERRDESRRREKRSEERRDERDDRRDERDDRREERREDRREERRDDGRNQPRQESKKPEIRKMPFIGKMPVYKNLSKNSKLDDLKKDDQKKKEVEQVSKKRQEEMDAEIQKKVAEFKEKIAKAQLERQQAELAQPLPHPFLPLPHPFLPPPHQHQPPHQLPPPQHHPPPHHAPPQPPQPPPPATNAPPPTLPKDFQDALDIIFPSAEKSAEMAQQELFQGIPGLTPPGFPVGPLGGVMPTFPPTLSILGQPPPHLMMGFDMNAPLFQPRPQLYDTHVPIVPNSNQRQNKNRPKNKLNKKNDKNSTLAEMATSQDQSSAATTAPPQSTTTVTPAPTMVPKNKEELDDLAMLGIDADDVGAGI